MFMLASSATDSKTICFRQFSLHLVIQF